MYGWNEASKNAWNEASMPEMRQVCLERGKSAWN